MKIKKIFSLVILISTLSACAVMTSVEAPSGKKLDGLTYYMPKKDIMVTFSVNPPKTADSGTTDKTDTGEAEPADPKTIEATRNADAKTKDKYVTVGVTPAYPDLSKRYVLKHKSNWLSDNDLKITVTPAGLLSKSTSTYTSQVNASFKALAESTGMIIGAAMNKTDGKPDESTCDELDEYIVILKAENIEDKICGYTINIVRYDSSDGNDQQKKSSHNKDPDEEYSGLFYKQEIPYLVTVTKGTFKKTVIVFSPSESMTHFLPMSRSFFANNVADFTLTDGIPTTYNQDTKSELVQLFALPADIIGAYFTGVSKIFTTLTNLDTKSYILESNKKMHDLCIAAIQSKDKKLVTELGCNKLGTESVTTEK